MSNKRFFPTLESLFKKLFNDLLFVHLDKIDAVTLTEFKDEYMSVAEHVKTISEKIGFTSNLMKELNDGE
jgi:hypothetical protein